uniref:Uncharacterized protein n=1 Tax=Arundo donax TaxID=35708 RepID=A0A0A8Y304_ARUDO
MSIADAIVYKHLLRDGCKSFSWLRDFLLRENANWKQRTSAT